MVTREQQAKIDRLMKGAGRVMVRPVEVDGTVTVVYDQNLGVVPKDVWLVFVTMDEQGETVSDGRVHPHSQMAAAWYSGQHGVN
jgi:hypothetical protein